MIIRAEIQPDGRSAYIQVLCVDLRFHVHASGVRTLLCLLAPLPICSSRGSFYFFGSSTFTTLCRVNVDGNITRRCSNFGPPSNDENVSPSISAVKYAFASGSSGDITPASGNCFLCYLYSEPRPSILPLPPLTTACIVSISFYIITTRATLYLCNGISISVANSVSPSETPDAPAAILTPSLH